MNLSYHKEHQYILFKGGVLNTFRDIMPFMNPNWCHWVRYIIRTTNIYGLGWGCERFLRYTGNGGGVGWLVVFGLNDPLRQYYSLYRVVSQREGERKEKE